MSTIPAKQSVIPLNNGYLNALSGYKQQQIK